MIVALRALADCNDILVVGPSWVGDMVMSQSLYTWLRETRPGCNIDVLAPAWSEPIIERMPEVRAAINMPVGHGKLDLAARRQLGRELRGRYDQAILLPNSLKSALVPWLAGIPRRTGWRGEMRYGLLNDMRRLDEEALPLMVQRFVALGQEAGAPIPSTLPPPALRVDTQAAQASAAAFALDETAPLLALCPGAEFGGAKRWPESHYAEVASHYLQRGWQVALFGSNNDAAVTSAIREQAGHHEWCLDLAGKTRLAEAVDLLSLADAVVSNDSGLMHIAAALGRPLVVVYGATSPAFTPPLSNNSDLLVSDIDCAPCFERECPLQHHRCMREQTAGNVISRLDGLLSQEQSA